MSDEKKSTSPSGAVPAGSVSEIEKTPTATPPADTAQRPGGEAKPAAAAPPNVAACVACGPAAEARRGERHHRRDPRQRSAGNADHRGGEIRWRRDPVLLLPQGPLHRGELPDVHGRGLERSAGQIGPRLPGARRRRAEGHDRFAPRDGAAAGGAGIPPAAPSRGLRDLRPGRRMQTPGLFHGVRLPAFAARYAEVDEEQAQGDSPSITLDQERCIMCTRCVRFMAEVADEPSLGVFGRGTTEVVDVFPGKELATTSTRAISSISARSAR